TGEASVAVAGLLLPARQVGLLSPIHFPRALYFYLLAGPHPIGGDANPILRPPWLEPSDWGMGLIWVSPWVLAALWARGRAALALALGVGVLVGPTLFYYGLGWVQFGYRYAIDALPFAVALAAMGIRRQRWEHLLGPTTTVCLVITFWCA